MADKAYRKLLNKTGLISRKVDAVADSSGDEGMGPTNNAGAFVPVLVAGLQLAVPCRVAQQSQRARFRSKQDGKDAVISTLTIFTEYRTDVLERDRFTVDGVTYDTEEVNDPGLMHHHLEFVAKRIS